MMSKLGYYNIYIYQGSERELLMGTKYSLSVVLRGKVEVYGLKRLVIKTTHVAIRLNCVLVKILGEFTRHVCLYTRA